MLLACFAKALDHYLGVVNQIILDAYHPEIGSFEDAVKWVTNWQSRLDSAKQKIDQLTSHQLAQSLVPPEGANGEQWLAQLIANIAESYNAVSHVFTCGPPVSRLHDPCAEMVCSVVNRQLEAASKLMRDLESRKRFLEATVQCRQRREVPQFVLDRAAANEPIFSADEVSTWPEGLLDQLVSDGVLKPTDNARSVTCDACGHDHVETVEYIESPPGSELRAYIWCPENGRIRVPLSRLRCWTVNRDQLPVPDEQQPAEEAGRKGASKKRGAKDGPPKRSWTQSDLDNAIRAYKAKRASAYSDLVEGVKRGSAAAKQNARKLFGRNVIVRELGVKSPAMVTNSSVWQGIADELGLRGRSRKTRQAVKQRIGMEVAIEEQAVASGNSAVDEVVRRETIALVEKSMPAAEAEATIEKLQRGEITDDKARELIEVLADQKQDDRTRKVRQNL